MEPLIIDTIIEKVDANAANLDDQEKVISELSQKVVAMADQSNTIIKVAELVKKLQDNMNAIRWPVKEITEMSNRLATNNELLANPRKTKQVIFHTAGRLLWAVIVLFVGMVFLIMGWMNTARNLDQFRMNDVMWRYIKLTNHSQNLEYLQLVENSYLENPEKMKSMVEMEELRQNQINESHQKANKDEVKNPDRTTQIETFIHSPENKKIKRKVK